MNELISLLDTIPDISEKIESDYEYEGRKVPRVTKIIQRCIHNDGLMYWSNSLGFKRQSYQKTLNAAASIGSQCHNNIDAFLSGDIDAINNNIDIEAMMAYKSFLKWYNDVKLYTDIEIVLHEKTLTCKYFGGTLDGLYKINNKFYIVDYKTSNHVTYNYCLQIAAYIYMLRNELGIEVDGCIILQLSKTDVAYNEFMLDFDNPADKQYMDDCEGAFLAMVYWYYNLTNIEIGFNNIGWKA